AQRPTFNAQPSTFNSSVNFAPPNPPWMFARQSFWSWALSVGRLSPKLRVLVSDLPLENTGYICDAPARVPFPPAMVRRAACLRSIGHCPHLPGIVGGLLVVACIRFACRSGHLRSEQARANGIGQRYPRPE